MIAEIPSGALEVPDNALWNIGGYVLTVLISGFCGYRWGLKSLRYAKILEVKTAMLPLIETVIVRTNGKRNGWYGLRPESITQLRDPSVKLKSLLTGRKRKMLVKAWEEFEKTTPDEFHIPQPNEGQEQEQKMESLFLGRLKAIRSAVERI